MSQRINAKDHEPGIELGKQETQTMLVSFCRFTCLPDSHRLAQLRLASNATLARSRSTAARLALEYFPELQALIGGCGSEHLAVRTQATVKYTSLMSRNLNVANKSRVAPNAEGVVREAT